jgi:hypothetical protein
MWLKQSTAVTIKFGPFVDSTDGVTAETALTISQADIRLSKNGGDIAQSNNATGATHDELGYYDIPLDTTDTNTLGTLRVAVSESGALPVWRDFMVVPANVWDSFFGADKLQVDMVEISGDSTSADNLESYTDGTTPQPVNVTQISGDSTAADNLEAYTDGTTPMPVNATQLSGDAGAADNAEAFFDGTGYAGTNNVIPTVTDVTTKTGYRLSSTGVDDVLDEAVEGANTVRQYLRLIASSLFGKLSGGGTTSVAIRDVADTKDRISATVDGDGNRNAITLDPS